MRKVGNHVTPTVYVNGLGEAGMESSFTRTSGRSGYTRTWSECRLLVGIVRTLSRAVVPPIMHPSRRIEPDQPVTETCILDDITTTSSSPLSGSAARWPLLCCPSRGLEPDQALFAEVNIPQRAVSLVTGDSTDKRRAILHVEYPLSRTPQHSVREGLPNHPRISEFLLPELVQYRHPSPSLIHPSSQIP
jgi:hypothetical protein